MKKSFNASLRNLTNLATECLRNGDTETMVKIQNIIVQLLDLEQLFENKGASNNG